MTFGFSVGKGGTPPGSSAVLGRVSGLARTSGFGIKVVGFGVLGFRVWDLGCGVLGLGFRVWGFGFRV